MTITFEKFSGCEAPGGKPVFATFLFNGGEYILAGIGVVFFVVALVQLVRVFLEKNKNVRNGRVAGVVFFTICAVGFVFFSFASANAHSKVVNAYRDLEAKGYVVRELDVDHSTVIVGNHNCKGVLVTLYIDKQTGTYEAGLVIKSNDHQEAVSVNDLKLLTEQHGC